MVPNKDIKLCMGSQDFPTAPTSRDQEIWNQKDMIRESHPCFLYDSGRDDELLDFCDPQVKGHGGANSPAEPSAVVGIDEVISGRCGTVFSIKLRVWL